MAERVSRAFFAHHKKANVALSKAADLAIDTSDVGVQSRTAPFIISTAAVDRDGDTLALNGWDLDDYRANPIVLFDHDPAKPIGKSEQIWTADGALRAIAWFPGKDVDETGLSDWVFKMVGAGVLRTASVTFLPLDFQQATNRAAYGQTPIDFKHQKLLEWSVVSVPSNQEALVQAKGLKVDWKQYNDVLEQALDGSAPLDAPRIEYEKTHAVVKSFLQACGAKPPAKGTDDNPMKTSKAGNVLNKDNLNRLKAAQKHMDKADEFHKDIDALKAKAAAHMSKCAEHMKAIMDSHDAGKATGDTDEGGDSSVESDEAKKKIDEDKEESKTQDGEGSEDNVNDKPVGSGKIEPTVNVNIPDGDDYYREYSAKKAVDDAVIERARAALNGTQTPKPVTAKSLFENATDEDIKAAVAIAVERERQKQLRVLRGQD